MTSSSNYTCLFDVPREPFSDIDNANADIIKKENLPTVSLNTIPLQVFQTYMDKARIPQIVFDKMKQFAPEFTHTVLDDAEGETFIQTYFTGPVLDTYRILKAAHKADLLRYCLLYVHGGVYMDIKTDLIAPIRDLFTNPDYLYTIICCNYWTIFNGVIAARPRHPLFLELIRHIVQVGVTDYYMAFCEYFYKRIQEDLPDHTLKQGVNQGVKYAYYLFQEHCWRDKSLCYDGLDKYGVCSIITQGETTIIKTRMASYPW